MKPNFALSLSFEGIKLLHRVAGGWREVGEVSVTVDDLAGELAMLRKTASGLEPGGVRSKLIVPESQIKYLTIETIGLSEPARRKEAQAALHNATPYEISELAYDISIDGPNTHIAAVARETLAEAEAFATEHRFHPVSFVAVPEDVNYLGEPFFGPTQGAPDLLEPEETVERDDTTVIIAGAIPAAPVAPAEPIAEATSIEPQRTEEPTPELHADTTSEDESVAELRQTDDIPVDDLTKEAQPEISSPAPATVTPSETSKTEEELPLLAPLAEPALEGDSGETPDAATTPADKVQVDAPKADQTPLPVPAAVSSAQVSDVVQTPELPLSQIPETVTEAKASTSNEAETVKVEHVAAVVPPPAPKKPTVSATRRVVAQKGSNSAQAAATGFTSRRNTDATLATHKPLGGAQRNETTTPAPDSSSLTQPMPAVTEPPAPAAKIGFLSRRKPRKGAAAPIPAATAEVPATGNETERMTIFGARSDQIGGKPRFLGLIMTVILLVFLAGVAAWAAVFLDEGIAGLMKRGEGRAIASAPENQIDPEIIRTPDGVADTNALSDEGLQVAALDPVLSAEDAAVLDVLQDPRPEPQRPVITEQEAAARYAVTGIWPLAPMTTQSQPQPQAPPVFRSGIDAASSATDAIALPQVQALEPSVQLTAALSPPPYGQRAALGTGGLIEPTAEGIITPGGYTLIAASPPIKPPATAARFTPQSTATAPVVVAAVATSPLLRFRPQNRPRGLAERSERAQLGGVTRLELAAFRPSLRPRSIQDRAKQAEDEAKKAEQARQAEEDERATAAATAAAAAALAVPETPETAAPSIETATKYAIAKSIRPDTRPRNFDRIVKRAERAPAKETRVAAAVAPRTVAPKIPSKASVARSATVKNAINLRKVNLIGVYGKPSSRRALVRLSNGRYKKVSVGDRIDGGRVSAISNSELRYSKGGRNVVLKMP